MQVLPIQKQENTNFNGLTKALKNKIYIDGQKDIEQLLLRKPNVKPIVGQLPAYVFNKIPKELRKVAIPEILKAFDDVAYMLRDFYHPRAWMIFDQTELNRPQEANDILTKVFQKYNVIRPYDEIDLVWLGKGGRGKAYKITGLYDRDNEEEYVLKVFHQIKNDNWHPFKSHGCYAELNSAMYWREQEGMDTHRGKFYMGSLGSGYMVTKFLDEDTRLPKRIVPEYKYGIKCTDERKYKTKASYEQDYNYVKDYNFDYGGMRVVNRIKNGNRCARMFMERIRNHPENTRKQYWEALMADPKKDENKIAGLALGIKYLDDREVFIDKCLKFNMPKVNQSLAYVLKYLDEDSAKKYFEILMKTNDEVTQIIAMNEIPLLAKKKDENYVIQDDIHAILQEIQPEVIYDYYKIAEKYARPDTVEHLASYVDLLPKRVLKKQYTKLTNINNEALFERLLYKFCFLPEDFRGYALIKIAQKVEGDMFKDDIIKLANYAGPEAKAFIEQKYNIKL